MIKMSVKKIRKGILRGALAVLALVGTVTTVLAANLAEISLTEKDGTIEVKAGFHTEGQNLLEQGILISESDADVQMDTEGRKRIVFTEKDEQGTCLLEVPNNEVNYNAYYRAYAIFEDGAGNTRIALSDCFNVDTYEEFNNQTVVFDNIQYKQIDGGYEVVGVVEAEAVITIPETVDGQTVIKIADHAFENDRTLTVIDLPDTIQVIGKRAFAGCSSLTEMN